MVENGKTGFLFECGNVKDLREKTGRVGYEKAKKFPWDKIAEETVV